MVWEDGRFSGYLREGIAFSTSRDGGFTWSAPEQVNQVHTVQAFSPSIAVGASGTIAITYYDFRKDTADMNTLLASCWRIVSSDGGTTWREVPLAGPFNLLNAALSGVRAPFLGDYHGLVASHDIFLAFFAVANSGDLAHSSSIFATSTARAGDTMSTGRTEINRNPLPYRPSPVREPGRVLPHPQRR